MARVRGLGSPVPEADEESVADVGAPAPQGNDEAAAAADEEAASEDAPEDDDGEQPNVSPEEQAQYDQFTDRGRSLLYDKRTIPQLENQLKADANRPEGAPPEGLASSVVNVVMRLQDDAKQNGVKLSKDVVYHGGMELIDDVADYAERKGIATYSPEDIEKAYLRALELYQSGGGEIDQKAAAHDMNALVEADKAGETESLFPGVAAHFGGQTESAEPAPEEE